MYNLSLIQCYVKQKDGTFFGVDVARMQERSWQDFDKLFPKEK